MKRNYRISAICLTAWICLSSCYESPRIDFHSYQELSEYNFIRNGWFPEILQPDAYNILETYDVNNSHLFGKFKFRNRPTYDSIIHTYRTVKPDSLLRKIEKNNKPRYPKWFVTKEDIAKNKYRMAEHHDFYLVLDDKTNTVYYLR